MRPARVLVTGFGPFPGAPVNPTTDLMRALAATGLPAYAGAELKTAILPVDWQEAGPALHAAGEGFSPDIAIHFGLALKSSGVRLERLASPDADPARADNAGNLAGASADGAPAGSQLPLEQIALALRASGLPVEWSDDAGGYLCNHVFHLSASGACAPLSGALSGFIHVPPGDILGAASLLGAARTIIAVSVSHWQRMQA